MTSAALCTSTKSMQLQLSVARSIQQSGNCEVSCCVCCCRRIFTERMSRRDTLFGLPRYVLAILRHMEAHSERLKWSLAEESNQLTLTLTWNFDSNKPRKTKVLQVLQVLQAYNSFIHSPATPQCVLVTRPTPPVKLKRTPDRKSHSHRVVLYTDAVIDNDSGGMSEKCHSKCCLCHGKISK